VIACSAGAGRKAMKLLVAVLIFIWLACGLFGAWRLDDMHLRTIVRGPITMAKAARDAPVSYPGPD
jgi:hypothetical protein